MRNARKIMAVIAIVSLFAFAPKQQKTFTFVFSPEETAMIFEALGELPAKKVEALRAKIVQEVEKQQQNKK